MQDLNKFDRLKFNDNDSEVEFEIPRHEESMSFEYNKTVMNNQLPSINDTEIKFIDDNSFTATEKMRSKYEICKNLDRLHPDQYQKKLKE